MCHCQVLWSQASQLLHLRKLARTAAETLEALQRQSPTDFPGSFSSLTPPGEAEHFEGDELLDDI